MGKITQDAIASKHYVMALPFAITDVTDADTSAHTLEATSLDYVMPWAGSIVGISVRHNADLTGGVLTWEATVAGTAVTALSVVTDDTNQQAYGSAGVTADEFVAGARIGLEYTKTGTVAPETTDVAATVFVLLKSIDL